MRKLNKDILTKQQRDLLVNLKFLKDEKFYLAGGTGLALQLRHRTSGDFDFYSQKSFDAQKVILKIKSKLKSVDTIQIEKDTLISRCKGIMVSFFAYPYPLLEPLIDLKDVYIASLNDIASMKIVAIIQRGTKRDFIDIYYLIREIGLKRILELYSKKYKESNPYLALQVLLYFKDADKEDLMLRRIQIKEQIRWDNVKKYIISEVKRVTGQI
jgi:hypothetical protein